MGNFGWQNWSQFGNVDLALQFAHLGNQSSTVNLNMKDTWHGALGMQYRIAKPWLLSLGLAYEYINAGSASINKTAGLLVGDLVGG